MTEHELTLPEADLAHEIAKEYVEAKLALAECQAVSRDDISVENETRLIQAERRFRKAESRRQLYMMDHL